jgi:hypothetical protein
MAALLVSVPFVGSASAFEVTNFYLPKVPDSNKTVSYEDVYDFVDDLSEYYEGLPSSMQFLLHYEDRFGDLTNEYVYIPNFFNDNKYTFRLVKKSTGAYHLGMFHPMLSGYSVGNSAPDFTVHKLRSHFGLRNENRMVHYDELGNGENYILVNSFEFEPTKYHFIEIKNNDLKDSFTILDIVKDNVGVLIAVGVGLMAILMGIAMIPKVIRRFTN